MAARRFGLHYHGDTRYMDLIGACAELRKKLVRDVLESLHPSIVREKTGNMIFQKDGSNRKLTLDKRIRYQNRTTTDKSHIFVFHNCLISVK